MSCKLVFSVYDSKANAFLQPFFAVSRGVAERSFFAAVIDERHDFNRFAEDYTLFELGEFDEESAQFSCLETPRSMALASHVLSMHKEMSNE